MEKGTPKRRHCPRLSGVQSEQRGALERHPEWDSAAALEEAAAMSSPNTGSDGNAGEPTRTLEVFNSMIEITLKKTILEKITLLPPPLKARTDNQRYHGFVLRKMEKQLEHHVSSHYH